MIHPSTSLLIKCNHTNETWLFNCPEGLQHDLIKQKIRTNQIKNIVLTNLSIENITGLVGFLSSLSLNSHFHKINLYGPTGLSKYLQLARKYSQTTFKYKIEVYTIKYGYLNSNLIYLIYSYPLDSKSQEFEYIVLEKEQLGRFISSKAQDFNIISGPLYGDLKLQHRFITPDGYIISGKFFTYGRSTGFKILYLIQKYGYRSSFESVTSATEIIKTDKTI